MCSLGPCSCPFGANVRSDSNFPDLNRPRVDVQAGRPVDRIKVRIGQYTQLNAAEPHGELQHTAQRRDILNRCLIAAIGAEPYALRSNTPAYSLGWHQWRAGHG